MRRDGSPCGRASCSSAIHGLSALPDVLLVDGTGRGPPAAPGSRYIWEQCSGYRAWVTHRPLRAEGTWPADERGATSPLVLDAERVGYWVRTKRGTRPLAAHAAWRTGPEVAVEVVRRRLGTGLAHRSPCAEPERPPFTSVRPQPLLLA